jgi:hypothetical protein
MRARVLSKREGGGGISALYVKDMSIIVRNIASVLSSQLETLILSQNNITNTIPLDPHCRSGMRRINTKLHFINSKRQPSPSTRSPTPSSLRCLHASIRLLERPRTWATMPVVVIVMIDTLQRNVHVHCDCVRLRSASNPRHGGGHLQHLPLLQSPCRRAAGGWRWRSGHQLARGAGDQHGMLRQDRGPPPDVVSGGAPAQGP